MSSPTFSLTISLIILIQIICISRGANFRNELPVIKIFEIRVITATKLEAGEEEHVVEKLPNSNIVVGEDIQPNSKLIFECDARYPVQWVYQGDGMPEYSTNTTQTQNSGGITRPDNLFAASISLGFRRPISNHDSGRYTCRSLQNPDLSVFYNLYVSDGKLFLNPEGEIIYFKKTDATVRIPCSVSNPKAAVSLQKSINGLVTCPLNDSITYDSSKGFELKVSNHFDPVGTYVCTAGFNNTYHVVRYTLIRENEGPIPIQIKETCSRNSDCQTSHACIQNKNGGYACTSPCGSVCGRNTQCDVTNHIPRCHCLPGHTGDPYHACYVNVKPESIEKDPCTPSPCGLNTVCERHGGVARCVCAPGFQGDPYVRCHSHYQQQQIQQQRDPCHPNPCGANSVCNQRNGFTSCSCRAGYYGQPPYCRAECEVNSHCPSDRACVLGRCKNPCEGACVHFRRTECRVINRNPVCATINCAPGYFGRDCLSVYTKQDGQIKIHERLGAASTTTSDQVTPCSPFPCGLNAECVIKKVNNTVLNVTSEIALCQCPPNLTGNSDIECYPIDEQIGSSESDENSDEESDKPIVVTTEKPTTTPKSTNISYQCTPECGINAKCVEGKNSCTCPTKFQGNPYIKCYPISCTTGDDCDNINASCISGKCVEQGLPLDTMNTTTAKQCGINAIHVLADGKSTCICPTNYTGIATIACHPITKDSESIAATAATTTTTIGKTPLESEPVDNKVQVCSNCGKNAKCVSRENNSTICECIRPFEGNPEIGCTLKCKEDSDCPRSIDYMCHKTSSQCVHPCDPDYQVDFVECGRNAVCKVKDYVPMRYCPENFPFGSPNVHCKENATMSDNRMPNRTCIDEKRFQCGPNSVCKRFHDDERCVCMPGHFGDPTTSLGCKLGLQCLKNSQCNTDEECANGKCFNLCRHRNICGPLAGCRAENHKTTCICHIGTVMNPKGECEPAKGALAERLLFFRSFEDV